MFATARVFNRGTLATTSWRKVPPRQYVADVAQTGQGVVVFRRAFRKFRQIARDPLSEIAKLDPRQAPEFVDCQNPLSGRANRGLRMEARAPEEAGASLATGTRWTSATHLRPSSRRPAR